MPSYGFRLRFILPETSGINHDANGLDILLPTEDKAIVLKSVSKDKKIEDSTNLAILGSTFPSDGEAYSCGNRVKNALLLCSTRLQMGVDVGKDKTKSVITERGKEWFKTVMKFKESTRIENDIHGLCVYPEETGVEVRFASLGARFRVLKSSTRFVEEFVKAYKLNPKLDDKQYLTLEVYNLSHFESSPKARFLTLVTAVECLCVRDARPETVLAQLRKLIDITKDGVLEDSEKKSLLDGLKYLERESISKSCRQLVKKHLGKDARALFNECYGIRSGLLHDGKVPEGKDLGTYIPKLDELVSQLILADIETPTG